jgi:hypothetical protein
METLFMGIVFLKEQSFHDRPETRVLERAAMKRRMILRSVDSAEAPAWAWLLDSVVELQSCKTGREGREIF